MIFYKYDGLMVNYLTKLIGGSLRKMSLAAKVSLAIYIFIFQGGDGGAIANGGLCAALQ